MRRRSLTQRQIRRGRRMRRKRRGRRNSGLDFLFPVIFIGLAMFIFFSDGFDISSLGLNSVLERVLPLIIGVVALIVIFFVFLWCLSRIAKKRKRDRYLASAISDIDSMEGSEFEEFLGAHFEAHGYKVEYTKGSGDMGVDLVISKDGYKYVVQAKRYSDKVGISAVQEVAGAIGFYSADKGMVITNSFFTSNAIELAAAHNIELWDRNKIIKTFSMID